MRIEWFPEGKRKAHIALFTLLALATIGIIALLAIWLGGTDPITTGTAALQVEGPIAGAGGWHLKKQADVDQEKARNGRPHDESG